MITYISELRLSGSRSGEIAGELGDLMLIVAKVPLGKRRSEDRP
jgi:hypothetical protein